VINVVGVDPGLVHTGVVRLIFNPGARTWEVTHLLVDGLDCDAVVRWVGLMPTDLTYIEGYRPWSHFTQDDRILAGISELKRRIPRSLVVTNMGVKQVVTDDLMKLLGVWQFRTASHHNDLRSAARIALLGVIKNPQMNQVLAGLVQDHIDGHSWQQV
jgi:hypothetical protein